MALNIGDVLTKLAKVLPADKMKVVGALIGELLPYAGDLEKLFAGGKKPYVPDPGDFSDDPPPPPPPPPPPTPVLRELGISLQWVNGEPHSVVDAIGFDSYCRYDVTSTADQFGNTLKEESLPHPVEWFWSWDGVKGGGPINKGSKAYNESNGYSCAFRVMGHNDGQRHVFAVWCAVAGVESNEISLSVD